jgi:cobalt-zinc-cadmium efflux system outer membrane protein
MARLLDIRSALTVLLTVFMLFRVTGCGTPVLHNAGVGDNELNRTNEPSDTDARAKTENALEQGHAPEVSRSGPVEVLTLEKAYDLAERHHPELTAARAHVKAAGGRIDQAGRFPNPELVGRMESAPPSGRTTGEAEYIGGISQSVPLGSRLEKAEQVAVEEQARRQQLLASTRLKLQKEIQGAFGTALYLDKVRRLQSQVVSNSVRLVELTRTRVDAGDSISQDLARAQLEQIRARVELKKIESLRQQAGLELATAMGLPGLKVGTLEGDLDRTLAIPKLKMVMNELESHPALRVARGDEAVQKARIELVESERIPDVNLELFYRRIQSSRTDAFDVGLSLPLPLFDRNRGAIDEARADADAAAEDVRAARQSLNRRLRRAHADLTRAVANAETMETEVLPRAATIRQTAEVRFEHGDINMMELLQTRRQWAEVRFRYLETLREAMDAWGEMRSFLN